MNRGTREDTEASLERIHQIDGVTDVLLVGIDGLGVAARSRLSAADLDRMAASLSMLHALTTSAARYFGGNAVMQTAVRGASGYLVFMSVGGHWIAAVIVSQTGDIERVITELCRLDDGLAVIQH